jgi:hypothetical protein
MSTFIKGLLSGFAVTVAIVVVIFYGFTSNPDNAGLIDHYRYRDWTPPAQTTSPSNTFPGLGPYNSDLYFEPKDSPNNNEKPRVSLPTDPLFYLVPQTPVLTLSKNDIETTCVWFSKGDRPNQDRMGIEIMFSENALNRIAEHLKTYQPSNTLPVLSIKNYEGTELALGIPDDILIRRIAKMGIDPIKSFSVSYREEDFLYGLLQYLSWSDYQFNANICEYGHENPVTPEWFKAFIEKHVGFTENEARIALDKIKNGTMP